MPLTFLGRSMIRCLSSSPKRDPHRMLAGSLKEESQHFSLAKSWPLLLGGHHHLFIDFLSFLCDDATLVCAHPTFIYIQGLINRVKCSVRLFGALFFHLKFSPRDVQHWCGTQLSSLWNFQGEDLFEVEVLWVPLVIAGDGSATVKCCFWRDWDIETTFFLFESSRRESPVGMGASICHHRAGS